MRILLGHNYYQHPGGEDAVFGSEAAMLRQHGHEVRVYERRNAEIGSGFFSKVRQLGSMRWSKKAYDDVRALIREFKPSVAHFHNTFFMMTPSVYDACRDEGVAVVQSLHNYRMVCANALFLRNGKVCELCHSGSQASGILHRCYHRSFLLSGVLADMICYHWRRNTWRQKVDRFIVANGFTQKQFIRLGIPAGKIVVKPHFVDDPVKAGPRVDGGYMLYAGRLSEEKGVGVLLRAWEELKEIPLYIAGSGSLLSSVQQEIKRRRLGNVRVLGFLDGEHYQEILSKASALIIPSLCYENFPRVVVEAYAHGVPVVASRMGSLQELVDEGRTGALFTVSDIEDLRRCVRGIWKDMRYLELGRNARALYEARYTRQMNHEALLDIYDQAIRSRGCLI